MTARALALWIGSTAMVCLGAVVAAAIVPVDDDSEAAPAPPSATLILETDDGPRGMLASVRTAQGPQPDSPADDWRGSRHAQPRRYTWLNDYTPSDTYNVVLVRGLSVKQVMGRLGRVRRDLGERTPGAAEMWFFEHSERSWPFVIQVHRRGRAVMLYLPYNFVWDKTLAALSRRGVAASFSTTVELDTYITVAKRGKVVRTFDAMFRPPRRGSLPEERGLDWGSRDGNVFATAWAFLERVTLTHVSRDWFASPHPTLVLADDLP